jgi:hypothetical protein
MLDMRIRTAKTPEDAKKRKKTSVLSLAPWRLGGFLLRIF